MSKINVYLPDDLEAEVREAELPVSAICQRALRDALDGLVAARAGEPVRGRFTGHLTAIVEDAKERMAAHGRQVTATELFGAIVTHGENLGARALALLGVELPAPSAPRAGRGDGELAADAREVLAGASRVALEMRHDHVGTEHVMLALAGPESPLHDLLGALGVTPSNLRRQIERLLADPWTTESVAPEVDTALLDRLETEVQRLAAELGRLRPREER